MKTTVFIYGTLKKGQCRGHVLSEQKSLGKAETTPEYTLFDCGAYPALVNTGSTSIQGELYEVDEKCLNILDRIEGAPFLYQLQKVNLKSHPDIQAKSYFFQQSTKSLKECGICWPKKKR